MKKSFLLILLLIIFVSSLIPNRVNALGLDASVGYWRQDPSGDIRSKGESLSIDDELNVDEKDRPFARLKVETPVAIPNLYLMATPMRFEGAGLKNVSFQFGDIIFDQDVAFDSEIKVDHYDIALYYSLPFLKLATLGKFNAEVGLNARIIDFEATIKQETLNRSETESFTFPIPMLYVGFQLRPIKLFSIEVEGRGVVYQSNHYYDATGRVKITPFNPLYFAGGYRYEDFEIDYHDVIGSIKVQGPFVEIGLEF
jgi:outer membrane protein